MKNAPSLKLLALLSRPKLSPLQVGQVESLLVDVEFESLKAHIFHHRIEGCCYCNIRDHFSHRVPQNFLTALKNKYQYSSSITLQQFGVLHAIRNNFKQAGIRVHILKGIPLAERLYGDIAKRYSKDIDLLIETKDRQKAHQILTEMEFNRLHMDDMNPEHHKIYLKKQKDIIYKRQSIVLELHFRLSPSSAQLERLTQIFLDSDEAHAKHDYRKIELIYLCWHANISNFHRLKWLVDIALFLEAESNPDFYHKLLKTAREFGLERHVLISIQLAKQLFSIDLPPEALKTNTVNTIIVRYLCNAALDNLKHLDRYLKFRISIYNSFYEILRSTLWKEKLNVVVWLLLPTHKDIELIGKQVGNQTVLLYLFRPFTFIYRRIMALQHKN
jgi:hypothetical protein